MVTPLRRRGFKEADPTVDAVKPGSPSSISYIRRAGMGFAGVSAAIMDLGVVGLEGLKGHWQALVAFVVG